MKIRKLTPKVLKKIIAEEKAKIKTQNHRKVNKNRSTTMTKSQLIEKKVNQLTKLALLEVREKIRIKKIQQARAAIKKSLK